MSYVQQIPVFELGIKLLLSHLDNENLPAKRSEMESRLTYISPQL